MKKMSYKKIFAIAALATFIFVLLPIASPTIELNSGSFFASPSLQTLLSPSGVNYAHAQSTAQQQLSNDPFSCSWTSSGVATCAMYLVAMAIVWVLKFLIALGSLLVQIGLQVNQHLYDSPTVTTGFSVSLSVANLGFVLAIIVIALATILRNQTYGAKQLLWKLVVMAIFINFGLVITRPIVNFADGLTNYFMGQISGASGDASAFTGKFVAAFSPQTMSDPVVVNPADITKTVVCSSLGYSVPGASALCNVAGSVVVYFSTNKSEIFVRTFLACVFAIFFSGIIAFVLFMLAVLLLVRYVYLGILLVLLPLAWLMWVLPKFSGEFNKWWNNFIKWTFFPPCALFFIYISLATITSQAYGNAALTTTSASASGNSIAGGIFTMTGLLTMIQQFADEFVLAGLMIGGLFASQALTGKAGSMVVSGGQAASKWVGGQAGHYGKKGGVALYNRAGGQKLTEKLQTSRIRPLAMAGRGLANVTNNKAMVEAAAKNVPDSKEMWEKNLRGSMNNEMRMAYLQKGAEKKWIGRDTMVGTENIADYLGKNKATFHNYGQNGEGSTEEKLRDQSGLSMHEAAVDKENAEKKNAELDEKREKSMTPKELERQAGIKAGVNEDDMQFYSTATPEEVEKNFTKEDREKYHGIKAKIDKAKSQVGLSESEQQEYNDNTEKITKAEGTVKRISVSNPELAGGMFMDLQQAQKKLQKEKKAPSITLNEESVKRMQTMMLDTFAKGFSPQNARGLLEAIAKANSMDQFKEAVKKLTTEKSDYFDKSLGQDGTNKDLRRWMQNSSSKALFGDIHELFEVPGGKKKKGNNDDDDE
jgi:hypothetical protein